MYCFTNCSESSDVIGGRYGREDVGISLNGGSDGDGRGEGEEGGEGTIVRVGRSVGGIVNECVVRDVGRGILGWGRVQSL